MSLQQPGSAHMSGCAELAQQCGRVGSPVTEDLAADPQTESIAKLQLMQRWAGNSAPANLSRLGCLIAPMPSFAFRDTLSPNRPVIGSDSAIPISVLPIQINS